jgi:hypothetical protein
VKNLQNTVVVAINCHVKGSELEVGLIVVSPSAESIQQLVDQDTGVKYTIALPNELTEQSLPSALNNLLLPIV